MSVVRQQMDGISTADMQTLTEAAFAFEDISGYSPEESLRAANSLMNQFGITAEEAYNLMVQGQQQGLDFSGAMTGSGELVLEAGLHHFSDADLSGVRKITVRKGAVVTGRALLGGNDLEVVSEGGAWAAECAGIGVFKLVGEPLAMPLLEPDNAKKVVRKCFAYAETDAASKALFLASTTAEWPAVSRLSLKADDRAMSFKATSGGIVIVIR